MNVYMVGNREREWVYIWWEQRVSGCIYGGNKVSGFIYGGNIESEWVYIWWEQRE